MTDETTTEEAPYGTFTCIDCPEDANVHPRKSPRGPAPKRCDKHKEAFTRAKTDARISALRESQGRAPLTDGPRMPDNIEVETQDVPVPVAPPEETWLDSDDAQELLLQKRQRELATGVTYDAETHGTVQDFLAADIAVEEADAVVEQGFQMSKGGLAELVEEARSDPHVAAENVVISPAATCIARCGFPDPPHVGLFCPNHWQQVSLEDRGILLGTQVNSEPFVDTAQRAVRRLRS